MLYHVVFISQGLLCHDLSAFPFLFTLLYWSLPYPFAHLSTLLFEKGSSTGPDVWPFRGVRGQIGEDGPTAVDIVRMHYLHFSFLDFYLEGFTMENKTKATEWERRPFNNFWRPLIALAQLGYLLCGCFLLTTVFFQFRRCIMFWFK